MAKLNPYLNFNGRCTEAMNFYKGIFGGDLQLMLAGDPPAKDQMPPEMHNQVMHSHLKSNFIEIMGSDMAPTKPVEGNTVYLALICENEDELNDYYNKLSEGGTVEQPLTKAFFGWFGSLEDKFGKHWMLQG
ncbi:VOC family protein [Agriterribacter sp.]|uniref:VOC family protein n=1 Tax=Agriterribacter sp. TaxID=2821509 RepID=UPI002C123B4E|nr:VOC family protein [Agriterribacter sp.]HRP58554.1 VOC family protein [Agriterribacter sp.]